MLSADSVTVTFGGIVALEEVSLQVEPGEIVGVIGPNGSGKSTLFNAITGYVPLTSGSVSLGSDRIDRLAPHVRVNRGLARTFQTPRIEEDRTVHGAVLSGFFPHVKASMLSSMFHGRRVSRELRANVQHAEDLVDSFGLGSHAGVLVGELPMGQVRMVDVARGMGSRPQFLLLDEPAAGLTSEEQDGLVREVKRLAAENVGVVLVEHNFALVGKLCDRIVVLNRGRVIASGTVAEVVRDPEVVSAYLGGDDSDTSSAPVAPRAEARGSDVDEVPALEVAGLSVRYGRIGVCDDIDLHVRRGEVLALLGPNGAGKSSLMKGISGAASSSGQVRLGGEDMSSRAAHRRATDGLAFVPEGRGNVFPLLTVEENLRIGERVGRRRTAPSRDELYDLFPILSNRSKQTAGTLSGGEQQMLAIAMAMAGGPSVMLLDEPSQGLAPAVVKQLADAIVRLSSLDLGIILAEQNHSLATAVSDRFIVMSQGRVVRSGDRTLLAKTDLSTEYFAVDTGESVA